MRALTVQQPWAWAIVHGGKDVENRTQAWSYRGPLAIHAGLAKPEQHNLASVAHQKAHGTEIPSHLVFGAIIGVVDLVSVHSEWDCMGGPTEALCTPWAQTACRGSHDEECPASTRPMVHLELANPRALAQPIPCKGRLGLWTPPADVLDQLQVMAR